MAKHTAGNWSVHGDKKTLIGGPTDKMLIAEVLHQHASVPEWDRPLEESQANARLIAAAPKLLAAIRDIVVCARINMPWGGSAYCISDHRMDAARDAIAQAEGESK